MNYCSRPWDSVTAATDEKALEMICKERNNLVKLLQNNAGKVASWWSHSRTTIESTKERMQRTKEEYCWMWSSGRGKWPVSNFWRVYKACFLISNSTYNTQDRVSGVSVSDFKKSFFHTKSVIAATLNGGICSQLDSYLVDSNAASTSWTEGFPGEGGGALPLWKENGVRIPGPAQMYASLVLYIEFIWVRAPAWHFAAICGIQGRVTET